jgi:protein SCO1/2
VTGLLVLVAVLAIVLGGSSKGPSGGAVSTSGPPAGGGFDGAAFPLGVRAPDFVLRDQRGRKVELSKFRGEVVALAFISTDCRSCTLVAQQIRGALDELAEAVAGAEAHTNGLGDALPALQVLFVSTDPRDDTPARIRRFLADTSLTRRAVYLTGDEMQLRRVWRAYRVTPLSTNRAASEAATTVLLIGSNGGERVGFGLEQITPEGLSHDIHLLQAG